LFRFFKAWFFLISILAIAILVYIAVPWYRFNAIIIHHSASNNDNYASIKEFHAKSRGWRDAAYHLILSNGSTYVPTGYLEATGRYHYLSFSPATKDPECNLQALHLCIVGNYNQRELPQKLRAPLAYALRSLQKKYHIRDSRILFHRDCNGTACPGRFISKEKIKDWVDLQADKCLPKIKNQQLEVIDATLMSFNPPWRSPLALEIVRFSRSCVRLIPSWSGS